MGGEGKLESYRVELHEKKRVALSAREIAIVITEKKRKGRLTSFYR